MVIRECREEDWEQVWHLWKLCRLTTPPGCISGRTARCCAAVALSLIADAGGIVVGSAVGTWDGERGWVCCVAVDPRLGRMGIAHRLLQELEDKFREKGATYLVTLVPKDNPETQSLFEASGFGQMADHIIMSKPLA